VLGCGSTLTPSTYDPVPSGLPAAEPVACGLMPIYPIRVFPDPVLRAATTPVTVFGAELARLVDDMLETMYEAPGVGLAGPQIGISKRLFVADVGDGPFMMANPEIVETSGKWKFEEGCLSVPGRWWEINRPAFARARGFDVDGKVVEYAGDELMGRLLQHETDHLQGMIILDRLPKRLRKEALKELRDTGPSGGF
jgi:peptide deformylase